MTKFFLLRHCESTSNSGENDCKDPSLSKNGINQANNLHGFFDLIIISPLRRTHETLNYSNIKYTEIIKSDLCRERIFHIRDLINDEDDNKSPENDIDYNNRVNSFKQFLMDIKNLKKYNTVLILSHAYFCASLGVYGIKNGEIRELYL